VNDALRAMSPPYTRRNPLARLARTLAWAFAYGRFAAGLTWLIFPSAVMPQRLWTIVAYQETTAA
jgi:hypothetical protein